jgi:hypothetical protein
MFTASSLDDANGPIAARNAATVRSVTILTSTPIFHKTKLLHFKARSTATLLEDNDDEEDCWRCRTSLREL